MKASELRIGNLLQGKNSIRKVGQIGKDYFTDEMGESTLFKHAKPIPLTIKWLLKYGFKSKFGDNKVKYPEHWDIFHLDMGRTDDQHLYMEAYPEEYDGPYDEHKSLFNISIRFYPNYVPEFPTEESEDSIYDTEINSVHQLQNLFYAIKGIEIK